MAIIALKQVIHNILKEYKSVAVIGASIKKDRPAHYVPAYLSKEGFRIFPVNPVYANKMVFNKSIYDNLKDIEENIDIVNIFRRSEYLMTEVEDILSVKPKIVWLQKGIENHEFAIELDNNGIDLIQDKCMLEEHKSMLRAS